MKLLSLVLLFLINTEFKEVLTDLLCKSVVTTCEPYCLKPNRTIMGRTAGMVWPQPQSISLDRIEVYVPIDKFKFYYEGTKCEVLDGVLERYQSLLLNQTHTTTWVVIEPPTDMPTMTQATVRLTGSCEDWPHEDMNEEYSVKIATIPARKDGPAFVTIEAKTPWGIMRALETFSQLIYKNDKRQVFMVNAILIEDFPRFKHRGVMLDTSRHFIPKLMILKNLDAMSYNKLNVFHWHIVDDTSFPYESKAYLDLSIKGAFDRLTHIYTPDAVKEILDYARRRGIRVIPEFYSPGNTASWGYGQPNLLTQCYKEDLKQNAFSEGYSVDGLIPNGFGPINPILDSTFTFLKTLFTEISQVFPDKYIHLGGDKVSFDCWKSNPSVKKFVKDNKITSYNQLEASYIKKLTELVSKIGRNYIVSQDVIVDSAKISKSEAIVEIVTTSPKEKAAEVTALGYKVLMSSCWNLDYISYGSDWKKFYSCEPQQFSGTETQKNLVIGGRVLLRGDFIDGTNLMPTLWPRASAAAERLWSDANLVDIDAAAPRLEEHRCRMVTRGINAQPQNGPSFCPSDYLMVSELLGH